MAAQKIPGIEGGQDENGIINITQPWHVDTLAEAFTVGDSSLLGIPYKDRKFGIWDSETIENGYQIGLTYEGASADTPDGENNATYAWSTSESKQSIDIFPKIDLLKETFGAFIDSEGHVKFPQQLGSDFEGAGAGGFAKGGRGEAGSTNNPMFNQESWPLFMSIFTRTYTKKSYQNNLLKQVGKIFQDPPGPFNLAIDGRDWVFKTPNVQQKGNVVSITEKYQLGPPGGWPPHIELLYQGGI
ncbi:MAG: hypothetical protein ACTSU8_02145 [Alphaproteobacteria bacterium]